MEEKDIQLGTATLTAGENVEAKTETNTVATGNDAKEPKERTYTQQEVDEMLKGKFSQEQVNEMIEKRLAREKKLAGNLTQTNNSEEITDVKNEMISLQLKLAEYEKQMALKDYRIDERYQDYVDYKVLHMTSKDKDYATALKEFFEEEDNKKYLFSETQTQQKPIPRPKNSNSLQNERAVDNNLRVAFGLAQK